MRGDLPPASGGDDRCGAWHRTVDHVSELQLELGAPSWRALLEEAVRALGQELGRGSPAGAVVESRRLEVDAHDREALLVDLLNEVLFLAETARWVPTEATVVEAGATRAVALVVGFKVEEAPCSVKAATLHGLEVVEHDGRWTAKVILDT
jgi:SHS2 domain-containing protein